MPAHKHAGDLIPSANQVLSAMQRGKLTDEAGYLRLASAVKSLVLLSVAVKVRITDSATASLLAEEELVAHLARVGIGGTQHVDLEPARSANCPAPAPLSACTAVTLGRSR